MINKKHKDEGNILIAKLMKLEWYFDINNHLLLGNNETGYYGVLYDKDYAALMPVIEKCFKLYKASNHLDTSLKLFHNNTPLWAGKERIWTAVVEFLKWYNEIQNNKRKRKN